MVAAADWMPCLVHPPDGEPVPTDGGLPDAALAGLGRADFGVYVHVPFCASRCGYCDFNTYTATELGGGGAQAAYADTLLGEVALAARVLGGAAPAAEHGLRRRRYADAAARR